MKLTKKLLALALVLAMVLAMAVTVSAAGGQIKTTGDVTYDVYKMFSITKSGSGYIYTATDSWKTFSATGYLTIDTETGNVMWDKTTAGTLVDAAAIAALANAHSTKGAKICTVSKSSSQTIVDDGYYLLVGDNGTCGVIAVVDDEEIDVTSKSTMVTGLPFVEKTVEEENMYGESNTADRGETINFKTVITTNVGANNYILYDTMDTALSLNASSIVVKKIVSSTEKTLMKNTDYNINAESNSFTISFTDSAIADLGDNDKIVVTYTGYLNSTAVAGTGYKNTTYLTHTSASAKTNKASTTSTTYKIDVTKTGNNNVLLSGAEFVLTKSENGTSKYYKCENNVVSWVEEAAATSYTSDADGELTFDGLDAGQYTLVEKKAPAGYKLAANTTFTIANANATQTINNELGAALPETGGMGTTIFYTVGAILVLAAVVLLATKKRSASK